jgi:hypothetical protein
MQEYMRVKVTKLESQHAHRISRTSDIFEGCHVLLTGKTTPRREELHEMIVSGGGVLEYYDGPKVTHVVADNLSHSKELQLKSRIDVIVVKPSWIVTSMEDGVLATVAHHLHAQFSHGSHIVTTSTSERNSQFIPHYFGSSRLHFIGTWKSRLMEFLTSKGIACMQINIARILESWNLGILEMRFSSQPFMLLL